MYSRYCDLVCYTQAAVKDIITVEEAARFLHKHPDTIRRWIDAKVLRARHLSAGSHGIYAILRSDLLEHAIAETFHRKEKAPKKSPRPQQRQLPLSP
jgi:excisionase family DNA binding protein